MVNLGFLYRRKSAKEEGSNLKIFFTREELFEKIWGYDYVSDAATVSVHINRLRIKLEEDPKDPKMIETIWGAGYRMNIKK